MTLPRLAEVAVRTSVDRTFHYSVPDDLAADLRIGQRVSVPFGPRLLAGTIVGFPEKSGFPRLKSLGRILDPEPICSDHLLALTRRLAAYYACAWGEVIEAAVPSGAKTGRVSRTQVVVRLAVPPSEAKEAAKVLQERAPRRARMLEILADLEEAPLARELCRMAHASGEPLKALALAGLVHLQHEEAEPDPLLTAEVQPQAPFPLTAEQKAALDAIDRPGHRVCLLHGITGSGKTEVYLQAIERLVSRGKQAIVLVPEIALTPQTVGRFRARFRDVAVLHSRLTEGQRHAQWDSIRSGKARVVVGARSAVFAPAPDLGLIVVDEEQEPSFKQQSRPRYHAREAAVMRSEMLGIPVVLGSATPCLESYAAAKEGRWTLLTLTERQAGGALPPVSVIDMRQELRERKRLVHLSSRLLESAGKAIADGGQVLLLLNRRGFATAISCRRCGFALKCAHCDISLTWHKREGRALCHTCDHVAVPPSDCPECGQPGLKYLGFGTERIEEELQSALPKARILRMDSDTTRGRTSHQRILAEFADGKADLLLGTQMIAKGLDIPRVTLVGVISADTALNLPDFRAAERTFQLLAQVAGRAGRGPRGGKVLVQTFHPGHPSIKAAATHDYPAFADAELVHRKALGYPPYGKLARAVVGGRQEDEARAKAKSLGEALREAARGEKDVEVLGPAPCPIARIEGWHRIHLLLKAADTGARTRILSACAKPLSEHSARVRVALDVDPTDLL